MLPSPSPPQRMRSRRVMVVCVVMVSTPRIGPAWSSPLEVGGSEEAAERCPHERTTGPVEGEVATAGGPQVDLGLVGRPGEDLVVVRLGEEPGHRERSDEREGE